MTFADRSSLLAFRAGWSGVRKMRPDAAYALFDSIADTAFARNTRDVQRLRANYARVRPELATPELESLVKAGMRSYMRYWCEAFRLVDLTREEILRSVRTVGAGPVRTELAQGRSVVAFLGHMGNWDMAGAWSGADLAPVVTVAERLRPEELFDEFVAFRTGLGMTILPLTGGDPPFQSLVEAARSGGCLIPLLADRDLTARGVPVDFCGSPARMAAGPAALAVATGSSLYPVSIHYESAPRTELPGGWRTVVTFHDRVEEPESRSPRERAGAMTQQCAAVMGKQIRRYTQDWHMMQRVFEADLLPISQHERP